jgi:acyl-coenzyme A thioesterase PaaI-like protein
MTHAEIEAAGWRQLDASHFNLTAGPFWTRRSEAGLEVALLAEEYHSNGNLGVVHGGALMTFADNALGLAVVHALGEAACATVQMSYSFTAAARIGSFITCRPELVRQTRSLMFVRGMVMAGDRVVGSAEGIWRVLDAGKMAALKGG